MNPLIAEGQNIRYSRAQICTTETEPKEKAASENANDGRQSPGTDQVRTRSVKVHALVAVGTAGGSVGLLLGEPTPLRHGLQG